MKSHYVILVRHGSRQRAARWHGCLQQAGPPTVGRLRLCCLQPSCLPCLSCRLPNSARAQYQAHTCILDIFTMQDNKSCIVVWSTMHPLGPCLPKPPWSQITISTPSPLPPLCMQPTAPLLPPSCPIDASVHVSQKLPILLKIPDSVKTPQKVATSS